MPERARLRPLLELTRMRLLEFFREPGALFWVFVFPVLLAIALGIAFRSRPQEVAAAAAAGEAPERYIEFLLPGLIGLNLMGSSMWGVGFAIVQTRVRKLLKRFAASPMHRSDYLLALVLSRLVFLAAEVAALLVAGRLIFGVTVQGPWPAVVVVALAGGLSFTGLALLIAARTTTVESASGWMNFVMLPMWVLSGSFFPYDRFPGVVLPAIRALPLTALNDALRLVINQGAGLAATWPELAILALWGMGGFLLALRIFRWM